MVSEIGAVAGEHYDRRLKTVPAQDAHGFAAVDVGQADIHDHKIDLSLLGYLHALGAILCRGSFKLLVQRKLLRQRIAQLGIIVDNENLTGIRHHFRPNSHSNAWPSKMKSAQELVAMRGSPNGQHQFFAAIG